MQIKKPVSEQPLPETAKKVFKGIIFDVYQWELEGYDGKVRTFEKLKRPDTAVIIPVTEDGKIIIAKQEQPGKKPFMGLVGGRLDEGEDPLEAAKRELLEETGYEGKVQLITMCLDDAYSTMERYCFVITDCKKVAEPKWDEDEFIDIELVTIEEFKKILKSGQMTDVEVGYLALDYLGLI